MTYDVAVVGDGLAGLFVLNQLLSCNPNLNIVNITDHKQLSSDASHIPYAVAALKGAKVNTALGGTIHRGHDALLEFIDHEKPKSVRKISAIYCSTYENIDLIEGRFSSFSHGDVPWVGESYFAEEEVLVFHMPSFLEEVKAIIKSKIKNGALHIENAFVVERDKNTLKTLCSKTIKANSIIWASGATSKLISPLFGDQSIVTKAQVVPGKYGMIEGALPFEGRLDFNELSFLSLPKENVIQFGSGEASIEDHINFFKKNGIAINELSFFRELRLKGKKRRPFWGKLSPYDYAIIGLYKNGLQYAPLGAKVIVEEMVTMGRIERPT